MLRKLKQDDIDYLDKHALSINQEETMAMVGKDIKGWLDTNDIVFNNTQVLEDGDNILGFGGYFVHDGKCLVWTMGTEYLFDNPSLFFRELKKGFDKLKEENDYIYSYVYEENIITKKWLEKMGFTIHGSEEIGVKNKRFHLFDWKRKCV